MTILISYRDFIDTQEKSYMTEDEILEKKNSEILMFYRAGGNSIYNQEMPEKMAPKTDKGNVRLERDRRKSRY